MDRTHIRLPFAEGAFHIPYSNKHKHPSVSRFSPRKTFCHILQPFHFLHLMCSFIYVRLSVCASCGAFLLLDVGPYQSALTAHHRIYHKSFDADKFSVTETKLLWNRFDNLKPNTQYLFYLVALSGRNDESSQPSEKIVVWTNPALSPSVDVSAITAPRNHQWQFPHKIFAPTHKYISHNNSHRLFTQTRSLPKVHRLPLCVWQWAIQHPKSHYMLAA